MRASRRAAFTCAATSTTRSRRSTSTAPPSPPFAAELKRALEGSGGTKLVDSADRARRSILDIASVVDDKQVLSLSGGGRVREYALTKRVPFSAARQRRPRLAAGRARSSSAARYTFNESEVLAREAQEQRLLTEMQTDAVQQIVRRLQAAKKPA